MSIVPSDPHDSSISAGGGASDLDVERDSGVPISTQIYWQIAYQIDSGRLQPGDRLAPVRELGAALRVNPNTIRSVYKRLADAGYVMSRHGAGTHVAARPPQRRGDEALAGLVAEMIRRAGQAGFAADEVASATFAAASERKRPGPLVRMLVAECTTADAAYDAQKLGEAFPESVEAEGTLLDELDDRLGRFHYDLIATTTFHAAEAQLLAAGRLPVIAIMVGAGYVGLVREVANLPAGSTVGLVCATARGTDNIAETLRLSRTTRVGILSAHPGSEDDLRRVDEQADLILMSREALARHVDERFSRPERIREWTYEFDPSGIELLRREIEAIQARRREASANGTEPAAASPTGEARTTAVARR